MGRLKEWLTKNGAIYQEEDSYIQHDGRRYALNPIFKRAHTVKATSLPMTELAWLLPLWTPDPQRVQKADTTHPLLVIRWKGKWAVIDGFHRLHKLANENATTVMVKEVQPSWLIEV